MFEISLNKNNRYKVELGECFYEFPPTPEDSEIENFGLPKEEQFFKKTIIPSCFDEIDFDEDGDVILSTQEQQDFFIRELYRRRNGCWYFINGQRIYITGHNYFYLNYWWIGAENETGFPEFRWGNSLLFYMVDWTFKNTRVLFLLFLTAKRFGKTEMFLSIGYNIATLNENRKIRLISLKLEVARINLFKNVVRSWKIMFPPFKPKDSAGSEPESRLFFGSPSKRGKTKLTEQKSLKLNSKKKYLNSIIEPRETKVSAVQGEKPHYVFVDEAASITGMDLRLFVSTAKQQLHVGFTNVIGKLFMPCTLEDLNEKGVPAYKELWDGSNPNQLEDPTVIRTKSGGVRFYIPAWVSLENFVDKFGFPMEFEAKEIIEKIVENESLENRLKTRRQFSRNAEEAFGLVNDSGLEDESLFVIEKTIEHLNAFNIEVTPRQIFEFNGEAVFEAPKSSKKIIYTSEEEVKPHVTYIIGIDGAASDKETSNDSKEKSDFAIVVDKLFDAIDQRNYCSVVTYSEFPDKLEDCYRIAYLLWKRYNQYGKCRIMVESSAAQVPAIFGYFKNLGASNALLHQFRYPGTDNFEIEKRVGTYRSPQVKDTQLFLVNKQVQKYGHHERDKRLLKSLKDTNVRNADLSSARQMSILGWGNFYLETIGDKPLPKEKQRGYFDRAQNRWIWSR